MSRRLRVAIGQFAAVLGDVEANVDTAVRATYAAEAADVLVLPEMFLTGYTAGPIEPVSPDDPRLEPLGEAVAQTGTIVFVGAPLPGPTISLLAAAPQPVRVYDKINLSGDEKRHFRRGETPAVLDVLGWSLGLGICYDGCFPEHARRLAWAGAEATLYSVAYFAGSEHRRDLYYRARALDNGMYVAVAGLTGRCGDAAFTGGSAIYDPEGRELVRVPDGEQGVVMADLDPSEVFHTRAAHPLLADA